MKSARIAVVAAGVLALVAFAGALRPSGAQSAANDTPPGGITVTGNGSITVTPDGGTMSFGTVSRAQTAAAALAAASRAVARVVDALLKAGVARKDIQTSEVSLSPRTNDGDDEVVGYTATNTVTAVVRSIGGLGSAIDAAVKAGANQLYGPGLLASDRDAAYRRALEAAVADARAKAETLAASSGATVGKIRAIVESGATPEPLPMATAARDAAATPIEPGAQTIEAIVTVTFASD